MSDEAVDMARGWLSIEVDATTDRYRLNGQPLTLGRDVSNDIVIPKSFVSRHHATLEWRDSAPVLVDNQSTHGLTVGGSRVPEYTLNSAEPIQIIGPSGEVVRMRLLTADSIEQPRPSSILRLSSDRSVISIGRHSSNSLVLDHPHVSRRHAIVTVGGGAATLEDLSTNGTFVNGHRVDGLHVLKPGDRVRIVTHEIEFDGRQLVEYDESRHARMDALHLSRIVGGSHRILNDVSFSVLPSELVAIVGTSGAGKSTLMDALNGFRPATSGTVLVNGHDYYREFAAMRLMVGYVPQTDVVHRELPTGRALMYAARLRFPSDTDAAERSARVQEVLNEVGLAERSGVQISQLSGGQIKRVSIGVELLTRPSLFFLDEPTSGLDPGYEKRMMEMLRALANQGRTIVLITHATQSIELCDHVAFMAPGGFLAYFGPPREALTYFDCTDYPGIYSRIDEAADGATLAARFQQHSAHAAHVARREPMLPPTTLDGSLDSTASDVARAPVPSAVQLAVLSMRYFDILTRDRRNLLLLLLQAPVIALLASMIAKPDSFLSLPDTAVSRTVLVVLGCSMIWLAAMNASREIVKELPIYRRERMVGLGVGPYLTSKYVVLAGLCLLQAAVLLIGIGLRATLPASGIVLPGGTELYITLALAAGAGLAMGLMMSTLFNTPDRASALVPYLLIPQIIFVVGNIEGATRVVASFTISRWTLQALGSTANLPAFAAGLAGLDPNDYTHSALFLISRWLILLAMMIAFTTASYIFLKRHDSDLMLRRARRSSTRQTS